MKTDRFADSIRRKLDSIRPDFSERDWVRMQAMLKQAGPLPNATPARPRVFSGQAARLIAAGAAGTVLFLGTTLYQTYELNRLRNSAPQAGHSYTKVDSTRTIPADTPVANRTDAPPVPTTDEPASPAVVRDTVYIDRYVRVPATPSPEHQQRLAHAPGATLGQPVDAGTAAEPLATERPQAGRQRATSPDERTDRPGTNPVAGMSTNSPAASPTDRPTGLRSKPGFSTDQPAYDRTNNSMGSASAFPAGQSAGNSAGSRGKATVSNGDSYAGRTGRSVSGSGSTGSGSGNGGTTDSYVAPVAGSAGGADRQRIVGTESAAQNQPPTDPATLAGTEAAGSSAIAAEPLQVQPVQLGVVAWEQRLMQRSRRMRPARTVVVGGPAMASTEPSSAKPEKPDRQSTPSPVRLRVGAGSDLNGKLWSVGGFAEVLAGRHMTFSVGLSRASFDNGKYVTEDDFTRQNRIDFRREFDVRQNLKYIDTRHDILSIQLQTVRLVVPVTVGYRFPISSSVAITPTLGTILNLQSNEQVSFIVRQPVIMPQYMNGPEYRSADFCAPRPFSLISNLTLGATVEWQQKHWGVQAGPVLSLTPQKDPDWISSLSGGLRARAFFQF